MWETIQKMPVWGVIGAIISALTIVLGFLNIGFGQKEVVKRTFLFIGRYILAGFTLPTRLDKIEKKLDSRDVLLEELKAQMIEMDGKVKVIHYHTQDNGGGSTTDKRKREIAEVKSELGQVTSVLMEMQIMLTLLTKSDKNIMQFVMLPDGRMEEISETFLLVFGYAESEVEGFGWENTVHPEDLQRVKAGWERAAKYCEAFVMVHRVQHSNGAYYTCKVEARPVADAEKCAKKFIGVFHLIVEKEK